MSKKYTVLFVDDESSHLQTIEESLPKDAHHLLYAPNGEIGFRLALKRCPDLIMTDWQMPQINGIEFIKMLKAEAATKDIPVIITTGVMIESEHLAIALAAGAMDYIPKPFEPVELSARVHSALQLSKAMQEIKAQNTAIMEQQYELATRNEKLREQRATLKELDQVKSRFFANISHELRTPLTLITSPLQQLVNDYASQFSPPTQETLHLIQRNVKQLKGLVDDIMDLSKLADHKMTLHEEAIELCPFLRQTATNFDVLAQRMDIDYQLRIAASLNDTVCRLDAVKLEKILNNLLSNAFKYTPSGGRIECIVHGEKGRLFIQVTDTGKGIPKIDLAHIFERFFQSKQPDAPLQGGTGIGLALVKEFSTLMNGEISVTSEYGQGSSFSLTIPYREATVRPETETDYFDEASATISLNHLSPKLSPIEQKQHQVLIVEDHPDIQQFIESILVHQYHIHIAHNGKQALQVLEQKQIDLVISDVMMPEMDGYTLLKQLKNHATYSLIPVIMLTALDDNTNKLQALNIGVDDYLTKPFLPNELLARVHNLISRYQVRQQFQEDVQIGQSTDTSSFIAASRNHTVQQVRESNAEWLTSVAEIMRKQLENHQFNLMDVAAHFHLSDRQFLRKVKKLTGLTPKQYQQEVALDQAKLLLEKGAFYNATAVAYSIGMKNVTYFSRLYEARFGKEPKSYFN